MVRVNFTRIGRTLLYVISVVIVFMAVAVGQAYIRESNRRQNPIDVIDDSVWRLELDKDSYATGEVITVHATYKKLVPITGVSSYYIYCDNDPSSEVRYKREDLGTVKANRPVTTSGIAKNDILVKVPTDKFSIVPNDSCYLEFSSNYGEGYQLESKATRTFKLTQGETSSEETTQSNDNQIVENSPVSTNRGNASRSPIPTLDNENSSDNVIIENSESVEQQPFVCEVGVTRVVLDIIGVIPPLRIC